MAELDLEALFEIDGMEVEKLPNGCLWCFAKIKDVDLVSGEAIYMSDKMTTGSF